MTSLSGNTIDERYELLSQIGCGGMGAVYKAIQHPFDREVAIKMLPAELPDEPEARARFEREALAISALKHKNIVMFYGYGVYRGAPYMVMEYINGSSLQQLLSKNEALKPKFAVRIAEQVAEALSCAHANGLVHRDLKPSNVMVVGDEQSFTVKIIDFGLARLLPSFGKELQKLTEAGSAIGSVLYMSPEQCIGDPSDARSDIYSLGCILHHCLTGVPPFAGDHSVVVMQQHVSEPLPRMNELVPGTHPDLQAIVDHATEKDPNERYQTAEEMLKDIRAFLTDATLVISTRIKGSGKSNPKLPPAMRPPRKLPRWPALAGAALITSLCAGSLWYVSSQQHEQLVARGKIENPMLLFREAEEAMTAYQQPKGLELFQRVIQADRQTQMLSGDRRLQSYLSLSRLYFDAADYPAARATVLEGFKCAVRDNLSNSPKCVALGCVFVGACDRQYKGEEGTAFMYSTLKFAKTRHDSTWGTWLFLLAQRLDSTIPHHDTEAIKLLTDNLAEVPHPKNRMQSYVLLGSMLARKHKLAEADVAFEQAHEIYDKNRFTDVEGLRWIGMCNIFQGHLKEARSLLEPLAARPDAGAGIWPSLAICLGADGDTAKAQKLFDDTLKFSHNADRTAESGFRSSVRTSALYLTEWLRARHREDEAARFAKYAALPEQ
jgi:tetratricopeptide (TPR) repeat protein